MQNLISQLDIIKRKYSGYWADRIFAQFEYALKVMKVKKSSNVKAIAEAADYILSKAGEDSAITRQAANETERILSGFSADAKQFKLLCASHAHIDMNWMWSYPETVAITLDTFRTMLNLMKEYPQFVFSQSQASVYRIVEEYDPRMLEEIRQRVKEGRWEVTASTWVEGDKNMPDGESLCRQMLYAKRYLSKLLNIPLEQLNIGFEPDTFGHSRNLPEILSMGGVKYYYHCRGFEKYNIYRWMSPSGKSVIVYRDPSWYNSPIDSSIALGVPEFCSNSSVDSMLLVFGVGDHGGGPTKKDINRIIDMSSWPVFPEIRLGTFREYFSGLEKTADKLPVVNDELNFVFTGCYTTQSRIKNANKISEIKLNQAETFSSFSSQLPGGMYNGAAFAGAWENVLFNQFHDILPGSCIIDSREYSMGMFQKTLAAVNTETTRALRHIADNIDTSACIETDTCSPALNEGGNYGPMSVGAGVGHGIKDFGISQVERGSGLKRIFHFFNSSARERLEPVEVTVWDWEGDPGRIIFQDASGNEAKHQIIEVIDPVFRDQIYWGHKYLKALVWVKVPAYGYSTYITSQKAPELQIRTTNPNPRVEAINNYVIENSKIKVVFNPSNASIVSFVDKQRGREMVDQTRPAGVFRLIEEDDSKIMTAWFEGRNMRIINLHSESNVRITKANMFSNSLRQWINYEISFRSSKLKVSISLDHDSTCLKYLVECDWRETGEIGKFVPQLSYWLPLGRSIERYIYDIPFGTIERNGMDMTVPANSCAAAVPDDGGSTLALIAEAKHGFKGVDNSLSLTLIRSAYFPDQFPEFGNHRIKFAVDLLDEAIPALLINRAYDINHPMLVLSGTAHAGTLPLSSVFMTVVEGNIAISAIKVPEDCGDGNRLIVRVYEPDGKAENVVLEFNKEVTGAYFVDLNEQPCDSSTEAGTEVVIDGRRVSFAAEAFSVTSLCVKF